MTSFPLTHFIRPNKLYFSSPSNKKNEDRYTKKYVANKPIV